MTAESVSVIQRVTTLRFGRAMRLAGVDYASGDAVPPDVLSPRMIRVLIDSRRLVEVAMDTAVLQPDGGATPSIPVVAPVGRLFDDDDDTDLPPVMGVGAGFPCLEPGCDRNLNSARALEKHQRDAH